MTKTLNPDARAILIESARQQAAITTLAGFVRYMWPHTQAVQLEWGQHLDLMCQELEWLAEGKARCMECWDDEPGCHACDEGWVFVNELVINIPPGHGKSWIGSVYFPAWLWLTNPALYLLTLGNVDDLAGRDSKRMRDLVISEPYQALVKRQAITDGTPVEVVTGADWESWGLDAAEKAKVKFMNTALGGRYARGITSAITGQRANGMIIDDPHDAKEVLLGESAKVAARMREVHTIYHGALRNRLNKGAWRLIIMQRLHQADLAGERIANPGRGTRVVCMPVRYDPTHPQRHPGDNREPDEWLCEAAFSEEEEDEVRRGMTPRHYGAQYGQGPSSDQGGTFKRGWMGRRYAAEPMSFAAKARFEWMEMTVDCTFKDGNRSDYVVLQVWGWKRKQTKQGCEPGRYLLDERRGRMDIIATCLALKDFKAKWPGVRRVTVEDKANGPAVIAIMKRDGHEKIVGWSPDKHGSKSARAEVAAVSFEAGDVALPASEPWVSDYIEEMVNFPAAPNDDRVDCTSMMMIRWNEMEGETGGAAWMDWARSL